MMKNRFFIALIFFFVSSTVIFSQSEKDSDKCHYVLINKSNYLFTMSVVKDSSRSSFGILKYKFRNKELQDKYKKKLKFYEFKEDFWINFWSNQKPSIEYLDDKIDICTIDDISKENVKFDSNIFFIESINCEQFLVYKCYLLGEE